MTRRTKIILISILLLLLITILREGGTIGLHLYGSFVTDTIKTEVSDYISTTKISKRELMHIPCISREGLKGIPLLIRYKEYKYGEQDTMGCPPVEVVIDHIDHDALWMPLYKRAHFHSTVPVPRVLTAYRQDGDSVQLYIYHLGGAIIVDGELTITGFCSNRQAKSLMIDEVMHSAHSALRTKLDTLGTTK